MSEVEKLRAEVEEGVAIEYWLRSEMARIYHEASATGPDAEWLYDQADQRYIDAIEDLDAIARGKKKMPKSATLSERAREAQN